MDPSMLKLAAQCAKAKGHTVGQWLEEAIKEKREREQEAGNVTKADC